MTAMQFEAKKMALKQDRNGFILTLVLHPDEIPEELIRDFVGARYACALVRINDDETPRTYSSHVQKAGIICRNREFWVFLSEHYSIPVLSEDDAASALCKLCGISSRSQLNGNTAAIDKFNELIKEFEWNGNDF